MFFDLNQCLCIDIKILIGIILGMNPTDHDKILLSVSRRAQRYEDWNYLYQLYLRFWFPRGWQFYPQGFDGLYTYFLIHKGNRIVKFSSEIKADQDDRYPQFALWVTTQNSPHLPKIYQARFLKRYDIFCCMMEKLFPIAFDQFESDPLYNKHLYPSKTTWLASCIMNANQRQDFAYLAGTKARKLVDVYIKMVLRLGWPNDLHSGNVMSREDGSLVITDPYSGGSTNSSI
jgi:uncharacterized protein YqgQ